DGVAFRGAWAEWPVGAQGENQLYHFANYNFTLVATVSAEKVPEEFTPISLIGMKMNGDDNPVLLRLSYNSGGKWKLSCGAKAVQELSSNWEPKKAHQVAIVLQNGNQSSAYVDGKSVGEATCQLENKGSKGISHFYIGGDGGSAGSQEGVLVTVTNVLLYNRPLSSGEITALNKKLSISRQNDVERVTEDTNLASLANQNSEASVVQAALQQSSQTREKQQITTGGGSATTQQVPAALNSHAGGANSDGGTYCGSGLLPLLLLLLGLWGFAAL
ncbi:trans-sialidase, putative, partial [Trypanosoma cruzi marinkellei]